MKRKFIFAVFLFCLAFNLFGNDIQVLTPAGLPTLSMVKLINEDHKIDGVNINYKIEKNADGLVVDMLKKEGDIAIVPSNFAAQLYNKGLGYEILGTVGWGSFYLISHEEISSVKDLKNSELYVFGKGLTPDIILQNILIKNGLTPDKDVKINYVSSGNELAGFYLGKKAKIAVIPEPMLSKIMSKDKSTKINLNLNDEWKALTGSKLGYPQSTLVAKKELVENNPELIKKFVKDLEESIEFLHSSSDKKAQYVNNLNIMIDTSILDEILGKANLKFIKAQDCKDEYNNYFKILYDTNSKVIGGKLPNEEVFAIFN